MNIEKESWLGLAEKELEKVRTIFIDLKSYLRPQDWILVGGLPLRYYLSEQGKKWEYPFNDLDIISKHRSVLSSTVCEKFNVRHNHNAGNISLFYFQLSHKNYPGITIDIFGDPIPEGANFQEIFFFGRRVQIIIPEEMYLFKLRDIPLLANSKRGLPPKHITQLAILKELADHSIVKHLWNLRHTNTPELEPIYQYTSLEDAVAAVERSIEEKKDNIRKWTKSDPLKSCTECIHDPRFPLLRDSIG
jgi:hypothetical protein